MTDKIDLGKQKSMERVLRWRRQHPDKWRAIKRRYYRKSATNMSRKGLIWEPLEDLAILERHYPDRELSAALGRSVAAIQRRRSQLVNNIEKFLQPADPSADPDGQGSSEGETTPADQTATAGSSGAGNSGP